VVQHKLRRAQRVRGLVVLRGGGAGQTRHSGRAGRPPDWDDARRESGDSKWADAIDVPQQVDQREAILAKAGF
jgi:hypothetical protein